MVPSWKKITKLINKRQFHKSEQIWSGYYFWSNLESFLHLSAVKILNGKGQCSGSALAALSDLANRLSGVTDLRLIGCDLNPCSNLWPYCLCKPFTMVQTSHYPLGHSLKPK